MSTTVSPLTARPSRPPPSRKVSATVKTIQIGRSTARHQPNQRQRKRPMTEWTKPIGWEWRRATSQTIGMEQASPTLFAMKSAGVKPPPPASEA